MADGDARQHHRKGEPGEFHEAEFDAGFLRESRCDQIGARAHQGAVAAEARAQRQRPPDGLNGVGAAERRREILDQGNHGGDERDVVDDRREDGRYPQRGAGRQPHVAACPLHQQMP